MRLGRRTILRRPIDPPLLQVALRESVLADARDVIQGVSRPVLALTCVAGSHPAGCGTQGEARRSCSARGHNSFHPLPPPPYPITFPRLASRLAPTALCAPTPAVKGPSAGL